MNTLHRICVFCGSSHGLRDAYRESAAAMGRALAARGIALVYGGGGIGLMEVLADAALEAGGHVIGVIPEALVAKELAHRRLSELRVVDSMHERKALMGDLSDAFVALPGGYGTLEELYEVLTWAQLGLHAKPCGLLNVEAYYDPLLAFMDHAVAEQFIRPTHRQMLVVDDDVSRLLDLLIAYRPPAPTKKWIDRDET
jgi:uncharacterized protein (TIGR00730 family)